MAASPDNPVVGKAVLNPAKEERNLAKVAPNQGNPDKVVRSRGNPVNLEALNPDGPVNPAEPSPVVRSRNLNPAGPAQRIPSPVSPAFPVARRPPPALPAPAAVVVVYPSNPWAWQHLHREPAVPGPLHNIDLLPPKTQPARPSWRNGDTACAGPRRGPLP